MAGQVFIVFMIGLLAMLSILEMIRFRRAARFPDGVPYPRRRLVRRIAIATLFSFSLIMIDFWPEPVSIGIQLTLSLSILALLGLAMGLLLMDLHETSRAIVQISAEFDRRTTEELQSLFKASREQSPDAERPLDDHPSNQPDDGRG